MPYKLFWTTKENETIKTMAKAGASLGEITKALERRTNVAVLIQARKLSALNTGVVPEGFTERQQNQTLPVTGVYVNFGRPYSPADDKLLLSMFHQSNSIEEMADKMGRSPNGLIQHVRALADNKVVNLAQLFNDIRPFLNMKRVERKPEPKSIEPEIEEEELSMTFDQYETEASSTRIYNEGIKVIYPTIGLAGETGEVADKVKKVIRDHCGNFDESNRKEIAKELGDVLWYLTSIANDLGYSLEDIAKMNIEKIKSRQRRDVIHGEGDNR